MSAPGSGRVIMLLQGPRSPFFARLADALAARGARVERVLFCPGDELYWRGRPARRFRGRLADWPAACAALLAETAATDLVALGDGRPLHAAAFAAARAAGVRAHVVEQGFLRPGWLTLEPGGLGRWRPDAPALAAAESDPEPAAPRWRTSFAAFAAMDAAYDLANLAAGWALYPGYRRHELGHPLREWAGWAAKAAAAPWRAAARGRALAAAEAAPGPLFLMALQLEGDFMVRDHGPAGGVAGALDRALAAFRAAAAPGARLLVKPHPLDARPGAWAARVAAAGEPRAIFLDGGELDGLLPRLAGVATVNSTVGLTALRGGVPVLALGRAIWEGLAHRGAPEAFFAAPARPDPRAVAAFAKALARALQVPGGFDGEGMAPGAEAIAARLLGRAADEAAA